MALLQISWQVPRAIETFILRHGPSATHPREREAAGFGVGAFDELSAECSELCNLVARVQAAKSSQVRNRSLGCTEQAPSRGHEASSQSGLDVDCKLLSSRRSFVG